MTIRRLAAIMAADVVGYSAIMEKDEEGTLTRLKSIERGVIQGKVLAHSGRIVKTMGDGFLAEFASPLEALKCALAIQAEVAAREQGISRHPVIRHDGCGALVVQLFSLEDGFMVSPSGTRGTGSTKVRAGRRQTLG
jgi:hypothetical protein